MEYRAAANSVNGNAINQIGFAARLPSANGSREEAEGIRLDSRESQPSNVDADRTRLLHWQKCYGALWEFKLSFEKQHNR